jgi:enhancing lycopene biosynthesis protein 2
MGSAEDELLRLGRRVVSSARNDGEGGKARFERAREELSRRCGCRVAVRTLFHSTSVENGRQIMAGGFKVSKNASSSAFGRGVNLSPDLKHTLMYVSPSGDACTLVCRVAIGRMHANTSRRVGGKADTVPDFIRPKRGYDAMCGADGVIVVVPAAARVLPVRMIVHTG